ncbi:NAC domain-containing protein 68 [Linum grandiflorum]
MDSDDFASPLGYRFQPKDEELVLGYLLNKLRGRPLPCGSVQDCDLYGELEPWEIWSKFHGDEDLYFFTPLKKKNQRDKKFLRSVGTHGATWHEENGESGENHDGKVKWEMKRYKYTTKECMEKKKKRKRGVYDDNDTCAGSDLTGVWFLDEYKLKDEEIPGVILDRRAVNSLVLCRLRQKEDSKNKKRKFVPYLDDEPAPVVAVENSNEMAIVECPVVVEEVVMNGSDASSGIIQQEIIPQEADEEDIWKIDNLENYMIMSSSDNGSTTDVTQKEEMWNLGDEDFNLEVEDDYTTSTAALVNAGSSSSNDVSGLELDEDFFNGLGDFDLI